jgi:hypothetical protein
MLANPHAHPNPVHSFIMYQLSPQSTEAMYIVAMLTVSSIYGAEFMLGWCCTSGTIVITERLPALHVNRTERGMRMELREVVQQQWRKILSKSLQRSLDVSCFFQIGKKLLGPAGSQQALLRLNCIRQGI